MWRQDRQGCGEGCRGRPSEKEGGTGHGRVGAGMDPGERVVGGDEGRVCMVGGAVGTDLGERIVGEGAG